jgi:rare lipoprotein A
VLVVLLAGCAAPRGGYYADDGPGANPPDVSRLPDAVPRSDPLSETGNKPYTVNGKSYVPVSSANGYRERGVASWYGRKFHGRRTSSGEPYDMYAMTAAHKTLPLPSYVRVRNLQNGKTVVVRVNDRGPFLHNRLIDLSYAAAARLDIAAHGTGLVEVEALGAESATAPSMAPLTRRMRECRKGQGWPRAASIPSANPRSRWQRNRRSKSFRRRRPRARRRR